MKNWIRLLNSMVFRYVKSKIFHISRKSKRTILNSGICAYLYVSGGPRTPSYSYFNVEFVNFYLTQGSLPDGGGGGSTDHLYTYKMLKKKSIIMKIDPTIIYAKSWDHSYWTYIISRVRMYSIFYMQSN